MNEAGAQKASELLQENHEKHHVFFNRAGFHNHIVHHLLTLYAIGATPDEIQKQYDQNKSYQRAPLPVKAEDVEALHDPAQFKKCLGKEKYYADYLAFFKREMEREGWHNVVNTYLFKGDEQADDLLRRVALTQYDIQGFLHPLIHLGFGIEFQQPAIIAEALAQACCHNDSRLGEYLLPSETQANNTITPSNSLVELLDAIHADTEIRSAAHWTDGNKIRDGILGRAGAKMVSYASRYTVPPSASLDEKTAEMINTAVYFTACAQNPTYGVMFDFYFMHCANASLFSSAFNVQEWITERDKRRLLEWKGRMDLIMYASCACPKLSLGDIEEYRSSPFSGGRDVFERVRVLDGDDGHAAKLVRAFAHGAVLSRPFEGRTGFRMEMRQWEKVGDMVMDSVEEAGRGETWVRGAGFEEAWGDVPRRMEIQL
ncbi:hypothetical protein FKW77_001977 [Venturia effusa]|uniref:Oxidoreductase AflY n=1 Tax=Venturia effusa TaxID=50376 RepID=A0A517KZ46_9PEZI|nr:hypothetical protein FKW77_001977 [Venturia effusa]